MLGGKVRDVAANCCSPISNLKVHKAAPLQEAAKRQIKLFCRGFFTVPGINSGGDECFAVFGINTLKHFHSHQFP